MKNTKLEVAQIKAKMADLRIDLLEMLEEAGSGHAGGSLSAMDILAVLYGREMQYDPADPRWEGRDRFVLSKGHVCPALYTVLAESGFFPKAELYTLRKYKSILQGHPFMHKTPGLDVSGGSLGQGLSVAVGMALAARADEKPNRIYCLMGDGELQEGQIWEAAMAAGQYKLSNLCGIVDNNGLQIDGRVADVMGVEPLRAKWEAFNWNTVCINGHDLEAINSAFFAARTCTDKPTVILADTVKGKGVSFMENNPAWHGAVPNAQQLEQAKRELEGGRLGYAQMDI